MSKNKKLFLVTEDEKRMKERHLENAKDLTKRNKQKNKL